MQRAGIKRGRVPRQTMVPRLIAPAPAQRAPTKKPAGKPLAIVLAKEGECNCCDLLEREGLDVLEAISPAEALQMAQDERPDLIVIDLRLPQSGGKELALEMKLLPALARVPVLGIQAEPGKGTGKNREIFDGYLTWPLQRQELRKIVRESLGRRVTREVDARRDRPLRMKS